MTTQNLWTLVSRKPRGRFFRPVAGVTPGTWAEARDAAYALRDLPEGTEVYYVPTQESAQVEEDRDNVLTENGKRFPIRWDSEPQVFASTEGLIAEYDVRTKSRYAPAPDGTFPRTTSAVFRARQQRINVLVDTLSDRADAGDPVALAWYEQPITGLLPTPAPATEIEVVDWRGESTFFGGDHTEAPATDANGSPCWNVFIHGYAFTTDSVEHQQAIGVFLQDEGYRVWVD